MATTTLERHAFACERPAFSRIFKRNGFKIDVESCEEGELPPAAGSLGVGLELQVVELHKLASMETSNHIYS